jgi:hypothetical protein
VRATIRVLVKDHLFCSCLTFAAHFAIRARITLLNAWSQHQLHRA